MERCACGRERPEADCCGAFLEGRATPATAEDLMRSRYTAYARGQVDYLVATHDPATLTKEGRQAIARAAASTKWQMLNVLGTERGGPEDEEGLVRFEARYTVGGRAHMLRELSRFRRIEGRWFYVDEVVDKPLTVKREGPKVGRNDPCPCGSGRKHKQCCGK